MRTHGCGSTLSLRAARGWSLAELMIVVAILGILSALAIPSYQQQQRKVRRGDARAALQQLQFDQVRYWGQHARFAGNIAELGWSNDRSPQGHYRLQLTEASADGYVAEAIPLGVQQADSTCHPMRMAWRDVATILYSSGPSLDSDTGQCW